MSASHRRGIGRSEKGSALVETALSLPLVLIVFFGSVDFARVFYTSIELTNAARAGAQYGASALARSGNIAGMQSIATGAVNVAGVAATASRLCQCATASGAFSSTSPSVNNCASVVATSCPGTHRVVTVTVTATKTFVTIGSFIPGFPTSVALSRTATQRVSE
jgi:Flp pilus assembly protein TadG